MPAPRGIMLRYLQAWRMRATLKQEELADKAGIARATVQRAERGGAVSLDNVRALAQALGITPEQLVMPPPGEPLQRGLSAVPLTRNDFDRTKWESVIADVEPNVCSYYTTRFLSKRNEMEAKGDLQAQAVFDLLGVITSLYMRLDEKDHPFFPAWEGPAGSGPTLSDISDNHWQALEEVAGDINDPEMRARVTDILWVGRSKHEMGRQAIDAYLESAKRLEDPAKWVYPAERIERALQLAMMLGPSEQFTKVRQYIEALLNQFSSSDPLYFSAKLMELLLDNKVTVGQTYAPVAEALAHRAEGERDWRRADRYWRIAARWHARDGNAQAQRLALLAAAETHVKNADEAARQSEPSYFAASIFLEEAIADLRKVGQTQRRVTELLGRLRDYRQRAMSEMRPIGYEIDVTEEVAWARSKIAGKSLEESLVTLALITPSPRKVALRKEVEEYTKQFPLLHLFPAYIPTETGRVVGKRPGMLSPDEQQEGFFQAEMFKRAGLYQIHNAVGRIEPARKQCASEHNTRVADLMDLVASNPFVPPGREWLYARGLHAGLMGDFVVALHLLLPQVENSLRHVLEQHGANVTKHNDEGIEDVMYLHELLDEHGALRGTLESLFGEDTVFDLEGLLVRRFGANLRNRSAHGLMNYEQLQSAESLYAWWLILRLCVLSLIGPQLAAQQRKLAEQSAGTDVAEGDHSGGPPAGQ